MKTKIIIIVSLLTLLVVGSTICRASVSVWLYILYTIILLACLVYYLLSLFNENKKLIEKRFSSLEIFFANAKNELGQLQIKHISEIEEKLDTIKKTINNSTETIDEIIGNRANDIVDQLRVQTENFETKFRNEQDLILSLTEKCEEFRSEMLNEVSTDVEQIQQHLNHIKELSENGRAKTIAFIEKQANDLIPIMEIQKESVEKAIGHSADNIANSIKICIDDLHSSVSTLSGLETETQSVISNKLYNVIQKIEELRLFVNACHEQVTDNINSQGQGIAENIAKGVNDASDIITEGFYKTRLSLAEAKDTILQSGKSYGESINENVSLAIQRSEAVKESVDSSSTQLKECLNDTMTQVVVGNINEEKNKCEIIDRIKKGETYVTNSLNGSIANVLLTIESQLDEIQKNTQNPKSHSSPA